MSTSLHDFPAAVVAAAGAYPAEQTDSLEGPTVDLLAGDGPCFAVQIVGAVVSGTTVAGRIEQSATGSSWSAISGAEFVEVDDSDQLEAIRFTPTARYVRWAADITGVGASALIAVLIGRQKKTF